MSCWRSWHAALAAWVLLEQLVGTRGNCTAYMQFDLYSNGSCCEAFRIFHDLNLYTRRFYLTKKIPIVKWVEFPFRASLVEEEPNERGNCPSEAGG